MDGWECAFVLHGWLYSETSLLVDLFTEGHREVRLLAKGARSGHSNLKGYSPLPPLLVRWGRRSEVKTLRNAEAVSLGSPLSGMMLYSGLYVNELLSWVLEQETNYAVLFFDYLKCLQTLSAEEHSPEYALRQFELALLNHLGYGLDFLHCAGSGQSVNDRMTYRYREEKSFIASLVVDHYSFTGRELRALAERQFHDMATLRTAKRFTRLVLKPYLCGKPLKSCELFCQLRC
ncbi:DNA repair protein RecO [Serratia symbiotica]|uniref:DNA repair protein RecO n=1 Tax=Serratia symbiotica TaxID=138074 RepID=UPI0030D3FB2E|nr:DNA repair protein RecO [Serratia symbiotica]